MPCLYRCLYHVYTDVYTHALAMPCYFQYNKPKLVSPVEGAGGSHTGGSMRDVVRARIPVVAATVHESAPVLLLVHINQHRHPGRDGRQSYHACADSSKRGVQVYGQIGG